VIYRVGRTDEVRHSWRRTISKDGFGLFTPSQRDAVAYLVLE
jgi:hypothetical protein